MSGNWINQENCPTTGQGSSLHPHKQNYPQRHEAPEYPDDQRRRNKAVWFWIRKINELQNISSNLFERNATLYGARSRQRRALQPYCRFVESWSHFVLTGDRKSTFYCAQFNHFSWTHQQRPHSLSWMYQRRFQDFSQRTFEQRSQEKTWLAWAFATSFHSINLSRKKLKKKKNRKILLLDLRQRDFSRWAILKK